MATGGGGAGEGDTCGTGAGGETAKHVFVTSGTQDGDFGGLATADGICQAAATGQSFGGTWKAWLSDGSARPRA